MNGSGGGAGVRLLMPTARKEFSCCFFCSNPLRILRLRDRPRYRFPPAVWRSARDTKNAVGQPTTRMCVNAET